MFKSFIFLLVHSFVQKFLSLLLQKDVLVACKKEIFYRFRLGIKFFDFDLVLSFSCALYDGFSDV